MEYIFMMMWIDIGVCLPLTILVSCYVCFVVRRDQVPVIFYTNLLFSNLIQLCALIILVTDYTSITLYLFFCGVMANLYFKICIALERYFFIACPQLDCIRQTKGSVLVSVLVWTFCIATFIPNLLWVEFVRPIIFVLLPAPLLIVFLVGTLIALPAATSVPAEEKRGVVRTLVLLLLNYFLLILLIASAVFGLPPFLSHMIFILFDLFLVFLMKKGYTKVLACPCCCNMNNTRADAAGDVATDVAADYECD